MKGENIDIRIAFGRINKKLRKWNSNEYTFLDVDKTYIIVSSAEGMVKNPCTIQNFGFAMDKSNFSEWFLTQADWIWEKTSTKLFFKNVFPLSWIHDQIYN